MTMPSDRAALLQIYSALGDAVVSTVERRPEKFKLSSGVESEIYCDLRPLMLDMSMCFSIARLMQRLLERLGSATVIGGPALAAAFLAPAVNFLSILQASSGAGTTPVHPLMITRDKKQHGTQTDVHFSYGFGLNVNPENAHLVILDDVVTSGGSIEKCVQVATREGLTVDAVIAILDRTGKEELTVHDHEGNEIVIDKYWPLFELGEERAEIRRTPRVTKRILAVPDEVLVKLVH